MKRRTLLRLVSLFSSLCLVYQPYILIPAFLDAWTALSQLAGGALPSIREQLQIQFFKALLGLILQVCFYGSVAFWSFYEASDKSVGSPLTPTEVKVNTPKVLAKNIQLFLIVAIVVIFIYGFNAIMNRVFHSASDFIIFIAMILVPLALVILIERKKVHDRLIAS